MIKLDITKDEFDVEGDFDNIMLELIEVASYCSDFIVSSLCESGYTLDAAKEKLEQCISDIKDDLVSNAQYISSSDNKYTS